MNNWKLMSLLDRMDAKGKKEFERWYAYELKGRKTHPWNLFQLVKKGGRNFDSYEAMGKALEKRTNATASKIRGYSSQLCKQIELFLSIEALKKDAYQQQLYLMTHYQQTNNRKAFERTYVQEKSQIEELSFLDADDYQRLFQLEELNYNHSPNPAGLQKVNELFDLEWTLRKLEMGCVNHSFQNMYKAKIASFMLEEISKELAGWAKSEGSLFHKIYLELYVLFTNPKGTDIKKILNFMDEHIKRKDRLSLKNAYTLLLNHHIYVYNTKGSDQSGLILLDIYRWGLEQKTIYINGKITPSHYKNLVTLPLKLGKIALGNKYLKSLKEHLNPKHKTEAFRYCQGAYYYYTKDFRKALQHWAKEKFQAFFYEVNSRIMSWEILYESNLERHTNELEENELIKSLQKLTSYIVGLEKIADQKKSVYGNRLHLYKGLFSTRSITDLQKLQVEASDTMSVDNRRWLLQMIEERKKDFTKK